MAKSVENVKTFNWATYLSETNSIAAPSECFFQYPEPPNNSFEEDMILETYDPRFPTIKCAAEVTAVFGAKIRLRMIGAVGYDDIWVLVDSPQIRPYGSAEKQGVTLQSPFNCRMDVSRFAKKLKNVIQARPAAPQHCFISEPKRPQTNLFRIGQKLEACEMRNPIFICPATVKDVQNDKIFIEFDGWNSSDWVKYDSRDLFPVGWWAKTGAGVQPPGKLKPKRNSNITPSKNQTPVKPEETSTGPKSTDNETKQVVILQQSTCSKQDESGMRNLFDSASLAEVVKSSTLIMPPPEESLSPGSGTPETSELQEQKKISTNNQQQMLKVKARKTISSHTTLQNITTDLNGCLPAETPPLATNGDLGDGDYKLSVVKEKSKKSKDVPKLKPKPTVVTSTNIEHVINAVRCKVSPSPGKAKRHLETKFKLYKTGTSGSTKEQHFIPIKNEEKQSSSVSPDESLLDGTPETADFVVYLNPSCAVGQWLDAARVRSWGMCRFGPGGANHVMRSCIQALIDCAAPRHVMHVLRAVEVASSSGTLGPLSVTADANGVTLSRRLMTFGSSLDAWKFLSAVLDRLRTCPHLLSKRFDSCASCLQETNNGQAPSKKIKLSPTVDALSIDNLGRVRHISGGSSSSTCTERDVTGSSSIGQNEDVPKWTVDDVVRFVLSASDSNTADLFKRQEIDGKALLLLSADMMIRYMNVRLGPALKIANSIDRLKSINTNNNTVSASARTIIPTSVNQQTITNSTDSANV